MMLQALLSELKSLSHIQPVILLDSRFSHLNLNTAVEVIIVGHHQNFFSVLRQAIQQCDAVWPIAPETDNILLKIAQMIEYHQKTVFLSDIEAIKLCSNKLMTVKRLQQHKIQTVETRLLSRAAFPNSTVVIKPVDGVGCEDCHIITMAEDWYRLLSTIVNPERFVIQPFVDGAARSLSCLFRNGKAWLLCCNEQQLGVKDGRFQFQACKVNVLPDTQRKYQSLLDKVAIAIPGLWGYVGIDLIESEHDGAQILEINPRLTTSFAGIHSATGINVSELVYDMLGQDPLIRPKYNKQVHVSLG